MTDRPNNTQADQHHLVEDADYERSLLEMEGRSSYVDGAQITHCPYAAGSIAAKHWLVGWLKSRTENPQDCPDV